jgi:hypothetical protein
MASTVLLNLQGFEHSEELSRLESLLAHDWNATASDLRSLASSPELSALSKALAPRSMPTLLEVLEEFGRIDRHDEHLHSRFLEFCLNPFEQRHGLSDSFLAAIVKRARFFRHGRPWEIRSGLDFADTKIVREAVSEQGRADFKLTNRRREFVILIENKTLSPEGDRQLARYWEDAEREHPDFAIGGFFLTPEGRPPSTAGDYTYQAISYSEVAELLDISAESRPANPTMMLAKQYALTVRRWFVEDPDKKKLAWRIFRKYPAAAAYISTDGAKPLWQISEHLQNLLKRAGSNLEMIYVSAGTKELSLGFVARAWDKIDKLRRSGTGEKAKEADDRLLAFWLYCYPQGEHEYEHQLNLYLHAMPGAPTDDVRSVMRAIIKEVPASSPGIEIHEEPQLQWTNVWARRLLDEEQLCELDRDAVFKMIEEGWQKFLDTDLPKIKRPSQLCSKKANSLR